MISVPISSLVGPDDVTVKEWCYIRLALDEGSEITSHLFGFCTKTLSYVLCSPILIDNDEWIETRSRKYFKEGPERTELTKYAAHQLRKYLLYTWAVREEEVNRVVSELYPYY